MYFCLFLIIGESLIRLDKRFDLLKMGPKKISIKLEQTDLLKNVDQHLFETDSLQFRILVLGDSYIHGGGIASSDKFSKKLSLKLNKNNNSGRQYIILDVSKPSNNTLDNYNSFIHYNQIFKPHLVFWAYNFNDILGGLDAKHIVSYESGLSKPVPKRTVKEISELKRWAKKVYSVSELLRYLSANIQKEFKVNGIVLPIGDFYYLTKRAYSKSSNDWKKTQRFLSEVSQICQSNQTEFLLYKMPEFNLLDETHLFTEINESLQNFCDSNKSITYINGDEDFRGLNENDFKLSKYDGHPNANAHFHITNTVFEQIKTNAQQ